MEKCVVIDDISLLHSKKIILISESSLSQKAESVDRVSSERLIENAAKTIAKACSLGPTNTDWASQCALIRKNHNLIIGKRKKKLKQL